MKSKLLYILIGLGLISGLYFLQERTIDRGTLSLIQKAGEIHSQEIWPGFDFSKYPIEVTYGKRGFRYEKGSIKEVKNTIGLEALSAIPTEDGPYILTVSLDKVRQIVDTGGASQRERENIYLSILLHEAFHCYQIEEGLKISAMKKEGIQGVDRSSKEYRDHKKFVDLQERLDQDKTYESLWEEESKALEHFEKEGKGQEWKEARGRRLEYEKKKLGRDFKDYHRMAQEMELVEGTARYVEEKTLYLLEGREGGGDKNFTKGMEKFYSMGSRKAFLLDKSEDWKKIKFDGRISLDNLLLERWAN